jgi:hypothetical protein
MTIVIYKSECRSIGQSKLSDKETTMTIRQTTLAAALALASMGPAHAQLSTAE